MSNEQENCGRSSRQQKIWVSDIRGPLSLNALDEYMGAVRRHPSPEISMTSTLGSFQSLKSIQRIGLQALTPQPDAATFSGWWNQAIKRVDKVHQKGLNLSINLVAWEIWKHHKDCVFNNATPSILVRTLEEGALWCTAGAQDLQSLL
ncbi:hypothetical protein C2845_PM04G09470 [Panicum miliaceum]|uniref:Uncharacterized protein n=1 Tax=Panicum miliaceum TaxID=4540 RepID=A0A3L6QRB0_PANMI|nr:hypothetical protein C2845_PM04G09470 [Panicum miliaceum]